LRFVGSVLFRLKIMTFFIRFLPLERIKLEDKFLGGKIIKLEDKFLREEKIIA